MQNARGDRFVVIEYVMLCGVNDSVEDAHRLAQLLSKVRVAGWELKRVILYMVLCAVSATVRRHIGCWAGYRLHCGTLKPCASYSTRTRAVHVLNQSAPTPWILIAQVYCMINLIVFNPHDGTPFKRSDDADVVAFRRVLGSAGKVRRRNRSCPD